MTLIFFLQTMFGILFVLRTSHVFRARAVISEKTVTKTGTAVIAAMCLAQFSFIASPIRAVFLTVSLAFFTLIFFHLLERRKISEFKECVPIFLDRWILNLRLGNSVSAAREAALRDENENFRALMRPVFDTRSRAHGEHVLLPANVLQELEQICTSTHASMSRLENLRSAVRKASEFRRKSGQAVRQTAIQSAVMLVLLFALSVFTVHRYGWTRCADLVTLSALLSLFGVALMMRLARKTRWKL